MFSGRHQEGAAKAQLAFAARNGAFNQGGFQQVVIHPADALDSLIFQFEIGVNTGVRHGGRSPLGKDRSVRLGPYNTGIS